MRAWQKGAILISFLAVFLISGCTDTSPKEIGAFEETTPTTTPAPTTPAPETTVPTVTLPTEPPAPLYEDFEKFKEIEDLLVQEEVDYSLSEQKIREFLESYPDSQLAPDVQFLLTLVIMSKNHRWIDNVVEVYGTQESIDELKKLIDEYGEERPDESAVKLFVNMPNWEHSIGGMFPLFSYVYPDFEGFHFWKDLHPEAKSLDETPGAQEIMQTPYAAYGKFALAELYRHAEFGEGAWPKYEERVDLTTGIFKELMEEYPQREIGDMGARRAAWILEEPAGSNLVKEYLLKHEDQIKKTSIRSEWRLGQLAAGLYGLTDDVNIPEEEFEWRIQKINKLTSPDDYFFWLRVSQPFPFPPVFESQEISFVVDETSIPEGAVPLILEAFQEWEDVSDGRIKFIRLDIRSPHPDNADRTIKKDEGLEYFEILVRGYEMEGGAAMGLADIRALQYPRVGEKYKYPTIEPVDIWLSMAPYENNPEVFKAVALHEIGHAIGLDHSYDPSDVMYLGTSDRNLDLTKRDVNTLKLVYDNYAQWQETKE